MSERFYETPAAGPRCSAPAALRNRGPISEVLAEWLPDKGLVLEVASGTGEHAVYFARKFPRLDWQPSDVHPDALRSIEGWRRSSGCKRIRAPLELDAADVRWPIESADAVLSINMAHISPWASSLGLIGGAARILPPGGPLILYGPWLIDEVTTTPSNLAFDEDLRRRNPEWGLRRVSDFASAAIERGFALVETRAMPANNLMLLLRRNSAPR